MSSLVKAGRLCLCVVLFTLFSVNYVKAETLHVGDTYSYSSINEAVTAANTGDIIIVHGGTNEYHENIVLSKQLILYGDNNPVVNGTISLEPYLRGSPFTINADRCTIQGFTITGGYNDAPGIVVYSNENIIQDNNISICNKGIYLEGTIDYSNWPHISIYPIAHNIINNNILRAIRGNSIELKIANNNTIYNNTCTDFDWEYGYPIYLDGCSNNTLYSNDFDYYLYNKNGYDTNNLNTWYNPLTNRGNLWKDYTGFDSNSDGIGDTPYLIDGNPSTYDPYPLMPSGPITPIPPKIRYVNVSPHATYATISWYTDQFDSNNRVKYSLNSDLSSCLWSEIHHSTDTPEILLTDILPNKTYYFQCYSYNAANTTYSNTNILNFSTPRAPIIITVDDDLLDYPEANYTNIQDAVNYAISGDTIWVYSGVYIENIIVDKAINLHGIGYPVLLGDDHPLIHLKKIGCNLDGFSFNCSKLSIPTSDNAGIWIGYTQIMPVECGNATISNCIFNRTYYGVYISSSDYSIISNCSFNQWGKGVYIKLGDGNTITNSSFNGQAIFLENSRNTNITNNWFNDHRANNAVTISLEGAVFNYCQGNQIQNNVFNNSCIYLNLFITDAVIRDNLFFIDNPETILSNTAFIRVMSGCQRISLQGNQLTGTGYYSMGAITGILLYYDSNCELLENEVSLFNKGISLEGCSKIVMRNNTMHNNIYNFYYVPISSFPDIPQQYFDNDIDESNTIDGKQILYLIGESAQKIDPHNHPQLGMLILVNCSEITIQNHVLQKNSHGIILYNTNNTIIEDVSCVLNHRSGASIYKSENITIKNCDLNNNGYDISSWSIDLAIDNICTGLYLHRVKEITVTGSTIKNNDRRGIDAWYLDNSIIYDNIIEDNGLDHPEGQVYGIYYEDGYGIHLSHYSKENNISSNSIRNNLENSQKYGLYTYYHSEGNTVYNNKFENGVNAYDNGLPQEWNIPKTLGENIIGGPYLGGNYWSDYELIGGDNNHDGLGDIEIPWTLNGNITSGDQYPLTNIILQDTEAPTINITSPITDHLYTSSVIQIRASSLDTDIDIWWYNLNNGTDVIFTPNTVITDLSDGDYDLIIHAKDFSGNENNITILFHVKIYTPSNILTPLSPTMPEVPIELSSFEIIIESPDSQRITERTITLKYKSPRPLQRTSYIIDNKEPTRLYSNSIEIDRLTIGFHTIIINGEDYYGELGRGEVTFYIAPLNLDSDAHTTSANYPDEAIYSFISKPTNYTLSFKARYITNGEVGLYINSYLIGDMGTNHEIISVSEEVTLVTYLEPANSWRDYNFTIDLKHLNFGAENYIGFIHQNNPDKQMGLQTWEIKDVVISPSQLSNIPLIQVNSHEKSFGLNSLLYPVIMIDGIDEPSLYDCYIYIKTPSGEILYYPEWGQDPTPVNSRLLIMNHYGQLSSAYRFDKNSELGIYYIVAKITQKNYYDPLALSMSRIVYSNTSAIHLFINQDTFTPKDTLTIDIALTSSPTPNNGSMVIQLETPDGKTMYLPGPVDNPLRIPLNPIQCYYQNLMEESLNNWVNGTYIIRASLYDSYGDMVSDETKLITIYNENKLLKGSIQTLTPCRINSKNLRLLDTQTLRTITRLSEGTGYTYNMSAPPGQYFLVGEIVASHYNTDTMNWIDGYVYSVPITRIGIYHEEDTVYNIKLYHSIGQETIETSQISLNNSHKPKTSLLLWTKENKITKINDLTNPLCTPNIYASVSVSDPVLRDIISDNPADDEITIKRFYSLRLQNQLQTQSTDVKVSSYGEIQDALNQQEQMLRNGEITEVNTDILAGINGEYMVTLTLNKLAERYHVYSVLYDLDLVTAVRRTSSEGDSLEQVINAAISSLGDLGVIIRQWEVTHPVPPRNPTLICNINPDKITPEEDKNEAKINIQVTNCWDEQVKGANVYLKEITERGYIKSTKQSSSLENYYGYVYDDTDETGIAGAEYTLNKGMRAGQDQINYLIEARGHKIVRGSTIIQINGLAIDVVAVNKTVAPYETTIINVDVYQIDQNGQRTPKEGAAILIEKAWLRDSKIVPLGALNADGMPITDANGRARFRFIAGEKEGIVDIPARYQALGYTESIRGVATIEVKSEKYLITYRWVESIDLWKQESTYGLLSSPGYGCRLDGYEWIGKYTFHMQAEVLWDAQSGREETDVIISYSKGFEYEHITQAWWPQIVGLVYNSEGEAMGVDVVGAHSITTTNSRGHVSCSSDLDNKITLKTKVKKDAEGNLYVYLNPIKIDVPVFGSYYAQVDTTYFEERHTGEYQYEDGIFKAIYYPYDSDSSSDEYSYTYDGKTYRPSPTYYADQIEKINNPYLERRFPEVFPDAAFLPLPVLSKSGSSYTPYKQSFHKDYSQRLYVYGQYMLPGEYESVNHGPEDFYWSRYEERDNQIELVRHESHYSYYPRWLINRGLEVTVVRK